MAYVHTQQQGSNTVDIKPDIGYLENNMPSYAIYITCGTKLRNDELNIPSSVLMLMLYNTACPALNGYCGETHLGNKSQLCLSHMESKCCL